jgi:hypothetical protein
MNRNAHIAAAIAAILGTAAGSGSAFATGAVPTLAEAASPDVSLYIAGSSAAKNAVLGALQTNLCGGASNALTITSSPNTNFLAVSCRPGTVANPVAGGDGTKVFTVYNRFEGGSVVGALPIANNDAVNQLDLSKTGSITCGATTCTATVNGTSSANGTTDTFTGAVSTHAVQMGILDVEPAALTGNNYPSPYNTANWGPVNPSGVAGLTSGVLFDQVFGIYVNTGTTAGIATPLNLSTQMVANILTKQVTDWSAVTDTGGNQVSSVSIPIVIVNREQGSGSRAATDQLIAGDVCQAGGAKIAEASKNAVDFFSTGDVLNALNTVGGGISYASIDNAVHSNETLVNLNGVTPTNLNAAGGSYPFWVESTFTTNPNAVADAALLTYLTSSMQAIGTAPHLGSILANPGVGGNTAHVDVVNHGNTATGSLTGLGSAKIYVNPFSRSKVTCTVPLEVAAVP